jgi:hypothetical protein
VGKTYILKEFGNKAYHNCCYINFEEMPGTRLCTFFGPIFAREAKYSVINFAGRVIFTPSEEFI